MNRILLSIGALIQSQTRVQRRRLFSVIGVAALAVLWQTPVSQAQETNLGDFLVVNGVPAGGFRVYETSYVLLSDRFDFNPMQFFEYDKQPGSNLFRNFFNENPDEIEFTLESDYYSPIQGVQMEYRYPQASASPLFISSAEPVEIEMDTVARYKGFDRAYKQNNPDPRPGQPPFAEAVRLRDERVYRPAIRKIPFYLQLELLSSDHEDMFMATHPVWRYLEPRVLNEFIGHHVSRIATGMFEPPFESDDRHIACPVWYEFKFMGYVDGLPNGVDGKDGATIYNLPDGVTFVSQITDCDGPPEPGRQIRGCALTGGNKIAVRMELLKDKFAVEADKRKHFLGPVLLHELAHAYGISGHSDDSDSLMADSTVEAPYVDKEQCEVLAIRNPNRPHIGFSGHEPWGK